MLCLHVIDMASGNTRAYGGDSDDSGKVMPDMYVSDAVCLQQHTRPHQQACLVAYTLTTELDN